ncbi:MULTISPECIES: NAD-dependent epimerase [Paenibacillus]|uniref:NAD-dependent epimerase n=1 Tax=Paenibacillus TaxID=44249 RepID=UPI000BBDFB28|nr:NAD-dependent epimerase [Paenibacillus lautus]PCL92282.1 capsular biosynthesis protein CpsI [Paenibacillus lautus]
MSILVTGCAGFIGSHVTARLLKEGHLVIGLDNLNDYYDVTLKKSRLELLKRPNFIFQKGNLEDRDGIERLFKQWEPKIVINLAAQAGVRYSLENPHTYIDSNIVGFTNILEACRHHKIEHLIYASSSSVYGLNTSLPYSTADTVDRPISLYAATKKANELLAHTYSHLFGLPTTGLRFFTVYGPWGRPDMALFIFTKAILEGSPIHIYNNGKMKRDFTYIDDIVEGIVRLIPLNPKPNPTPYKVYNIGNHSPVDLIAFIEIIEKKLGKVGDKRFMPLQPGDVPVTYADVSDLMKDTGFKPDTPIEIGIGNFIDWYKAYYPI